MPKKTRSHPRREESLSRESIIEASIAILDGNGEAGLTFRALSDRLATGPGAIYWHVANKSELMTAACDAIVARTMAACVVGQTPEDNIRAVALAMFDAIDAHPWVGSARISAPGNLPMVRLLERIGQQVGALGVPRDEQWATVGALLHYILGVAGQNAANGKLAREHDFDRSRYLDAVATAWSQLDPDAYPFTRSVAGQMRAHDDRVDFLAGIDLILGGMTQRGAAAPKGAQPALMKSTKARSGAGTRRRPG